MQLGTRVHDRVTERGLINARTVLNIRGDNLQQRYKKLAIYLMMERFTAVKRITFSLVNGRAREPMTTSPSPVTNCASIYTFFFSRVAIVKLIFSRVNNFFFKLFQVPSVIENKNITNK